MYERMLDKQLENIYPKTKSYMQKCIENKYPCNEGGWIHYRVTDEGRLEDILLALAVKLGR